MFKSLFSKYISAFLLILLFSFAVIISIITSIINSYSKQTKEDMIKNVSISACEYMQSNLEISAGDSLEIFTIKHSGKINDMLLTLTTNADEMAIVIYDNSGKILLASGKHSDEFYSINHIPSNFIEHFESSDEFMYLGHDNKIFEDPHVLYSSPIITRSGENVGNILVCSSAEILNDLLAVIVRSIILAILWVMLAALIAVYFISERVIAPLKDISRAAKSLASGNLDVRVRVRGSDEVAELAAAFNHMAESLEASEKMRNAFVSNVSHDLRTPMTSISGFVDGILDGVIPPEKHKHYLSIVSAEIKRLSRLVVSLLDLSRIEAGERKFTMAPFDICEMSRQILFSFEKKIDEKKLDIEFDIDEENMTAIADRDAIYQVLYNLCDNAVKFSAEKGTMRISVHKTKNRKYQVSIFNEGSGIPKEDLPHVFERFYKSDKSRGLDKSGVGLGLYICKTIMEAHEEDIWVTSDSGQNCCFCFTVKGQ